MTLVQEFTTDSYKVFRFEGAGTFVEGVYIQGKKKEFCISGSLQPMNGKELLVLPELDRVKQVYKLYTDSELLTIKECGLKNADRVEAYGERFVVMQTEKWLGTDLPYFKAILVRENLENEKRPDEG
jgi:hypothetical protein